MRAERGRHRRAGCGDAPDRVTHGWKILATTSEERAKEERRCQGGASPLLLLPTAPLWGVGDRLSWVLGTYA